MFHEVLEQFEEISDKLSRSKAQGENIKRLIDVREKIKDFDENKSELVDVGRVYLSRGSDFPRASFAKKAVASGPLLSPRMATAKGGGRSRFRVFIYMFPVVQRLPRPHIGSSRAG